MWVIKIDSKKKVKEFRKKIKDLNERDLFKNKDNNNGEYKCTKSNS
tara:strand:- start:12185 stop:12322 length:138 start_codon:yes stop_codon:yes gene_type:complete